MKRLMKNLGLIAALACVTISQASALTIPGVENTTGAVFAIAAPTSVKAGALEDNTSCSSSKSGRNTC